MDNCPLVSIITIVYNGEKYIADCIRSVQRQTYPNIEYIIVDGGSTDGTLSVIGQFRHAVARLVSEKDEGISDAFNKGLGLARGEIVGIINTDDWYEDTAVEKAVEALRDADVAYGDLRFWNAGTVDFITRGNHLHLKDEMTVNHPTVFVKKSCYDRLGTFDKQYRCAMDYDLLLRFLVNGCRFVHIPAVMANMRSGGMSDAQWKLGCRETLRIKDRYLASRSLSNRLYYYKHITAIRTMRLLSSLGLDFFVRFYRTRLAKVRKEYR